METKYVQFSDDTQKVIVSVFGSEQDTEVYAFLGEVGDDDPRYLAFIASPAPVVITDPLDKLKAFLEANPDVAAILK